MTRRISICRIVCSMVAAGLLAATVHFALEYRRMDRRFYEWMAARPVTVAVDLSRPGNVVAPFRQTCQISHGEAFYLCVSRPSGADRDESQLLQGLDGTITIKDTDGNEIQSLTMNTKVNPAGSSDAPIVLAYFHPFATGDYSVAMDVRSGAPALAGREQTIHAQYLLCGLERVPATIAGFLAFACGIPGLIVGAVVARGFLKYGLWAADANAGGSGDSIQTCSMS